MLAGCTMAPPVPPADSGTVRVAPDIAVRLPAPASLGREIEATQLVSAHYGDQTYVFEAHLSAQADHFLLQCLDGFGRKAMTVTWSPDGVKADVAPWLPGQLRPENMLADIVLIYWPDAEVSRALAAGGGRLTAGRDTRSIAGESGEAIHIDYASADPWNGALRYRNLAWGYGLDIQSVENRP